LSANSVVALPWLQIRLITCDRLDLENTSMRWRDVCTTVASVNQATEAYATTNSETGTQARRRTTMQPRCAGNATSISISCEIP
jgi:hypothetical protein